MAQKNLFGRQRRTTQVPPTISRDGSTASRDERSTSPRRVQGRHAAHYMRPQNERRTDPVRHARADVARAQGHPATRYGTHYGTLNPRDEAQAAYANRRRRSSRMKTGQVAIAVVIALILLWLVVTLVSSCVQGGATKDAASSDAQTTVTGIVSTSTN